jgi:hypothetical protein
MPGDNNRADDDGSCYDRASLRVIQVSGKPNDDGSQFNRVDDCEERDKSANSKDYCTKSLNVRRDR